MARRHEAAQPRGMMGYLVLLLDGVAGGGSGGLKIALIPLFAGRGIGGVTIVLADRQAAVLVVGSGLEGTTGQLVVLVLHMGLLLGEREGGGTGTVRRSIVASVASGAHVGTKTKTI